MKATHYIAVLALGIGLGYSALAQAPAGAPAGSTGVCKDGSFTSATSKSGACRGHKGIKTWYGASASAKSKAEKEPKRAKTAKKSAGAAAAAPAAAPAPAAHAEPTSRTARAPKSAASNTAQASGGGPGMVWVNTATNVYHCSGTRFYGKTKAGKYMSEAQAKAAGAHPERGKGCGQ